MAKEYIEKVFTKFEDHLNLPNNNRIIFSGKFGIGKSYFLNEFFNDEKYETEYFPIFLNPVNYSVSNNRDIFELIKFDILFQILDKDIIEFENFYFPIGNLVYQYFSNKFLNDFISSVDLLGEAIFDNQLPKSYSIIKSLGKLISKVSDASKGDFDKFKEEIEANSDLKIIKEFFEKEEIRIGSFYENNSVTQLIYQLIKSIEDKTKKEIVLVIDDLDRIDPEHIFRILNILSAHDRENENKFGFGKIVLVCDINNIKNIYHHFYGEKVDFLGYINKFYSLEVYHYTNRDYSFALGKDFLLRSYNRDSHYIEFFKYILSDAIENNIITARQLFNQDFSIQNIIKIFNSFSQYSHMQVYHNGKRVNNFSGFLRPYSLIKTGLYFFGDDRILLKLARITDIQQLLYNKEVLIDLLMYSELKTVKGVNMSFEVKGVTMKTNNAQEYEIADESNIENLDLVSVFEDTIRLTEELVLK